MPDAIDKAAIERGRDLLVIALRGLIYNRMAELGVTHADLAGRVGCTPKELNRVLMGRGMTILPFANIAYELGCRLKFDLTDKAPSAPTPEPEGGPDA